MLWLKRALIAVICVHLVLSGWSLYRRIWQVLRVDLKASSRVLTPGATASYDVVTSGEAHNRIVLELLRGTHAEVLAEERAQVNAVSACDPRAFRYEKRVTITVDLVARFEPGPATLRLTGFGGPKLLRTPAPRVRELDVEVRR